MVQQETNTGEILSGCASTENSSPAIPFYHRTIDLHNATSKFTVFCFDLDGVLWEGDSIISGSPEAISWLISEGKEVFFVTNNSTVNTNQILERFQKHGFPKIDPTRIYCTAEATANYLASIQFKGKIYMIGNDAMREAVSKLPGVNIFEPQQTEGATPTPNELSVVPLEKIDAVVIGFDKGVNYAKMAYASMILRQYPDIPFISTNKDTVYPANGRILPGAGTIVNTVEGASGRRSFIVGKPGSFIIDDIKKKVNKSQEEICMVGDNLLTDIAFARANGIGSILVESGVHNRHSAAASAVKPDMIISSLARFLT